jgi:ubiquinone/menaquinone biosynthesis C-methylase UbiE
MASAPDIIGHYARRDGLLARLRASLVEDGADPDRPSLAALAPYDHFHGRGVEATAEMAEALPVKPTDHLLDIGSGIGGPARYFADRFGCRVTGIDLTPDYNEVATALTRLAGLEHRVRFETGDALRLPFGDASFDGAYSMNVAMNIADKDGLYREIRRVLKPGAFLALSELARGPAAEEPDYPMPWATTAEASFLQTQEATRHGLEQAGFTITAFRDTVRESREYGARSRIAVERGEKPPHRAVFLMHGEIAKTMAANVARGVGEQRLVPIEILCRRGALKGERS